MALNFTPVVPTKTTVPKGAEFTDDFVAEFEEAWGYLIQNQEHHMAVEFDSADERDKWFNTAKAWGERRPDGIVHIRRIKGSDSMNKGHGHLVFTMEMDENKEKRRMAAAEYKADLQARKDRGEVIKRGRRKSA